MRDPEKFPHPLKQREKDISSSRAQNLILLIKMKETRYNNGLTRKVLVQYIYETFAPIGLLSMTETSKIRIHEIHISKMLQSRGRKSFNNTENPLVSGGFTSLATHQKIMDLHMGF